jgi:hypothetical protein
MLSIRHLLLLGLTTVTVVSINSLLATSSQAEYFWFVNRNDPLERDRSLKFPKYTALLRIGQW